LSSLSLPVATFPAGKLLGQSVFPEMVQKVMIGQLSTIVLSLVISEMKSSNSISTVVAMCILHNSSGRHRLWLVTCFLIS
jgi:hypothetical protein